MSRWTLSCLALCALLLAACISSTVSAPAGASGHAVAPPALTAYATTSPLPTIAANTTPRLLPTTAATETPTLLWMPTRTPYPADDRFVIGTSIEGRPIRVWRFGGGPRRILLVGGIHGGYEANSAELAELLVEHYQMHPEDVLPGIQIVIVPNANPDGLARGEGLPARFNANGVDLNRNWGCEWSAEAMLRDIEVDPGPRPFSEPETRALRAYIIAEPPQAVIFYHSAFGGVFMGACGAEHPPAEWLGDLLEESAGYPHQTFTHYDVTGDATNWLAERGIPAAVVELYTRTDPEFRRNLDGVMALQCYFALQGVSPGEASEPLAEATARLCL